MRARDAAPGELTGKLRGDATRKGNACSLSHLGLPAHVLDALEREGITDLLAWRKLGRRRLAIFGVTPRTAALLDAAAKEAAI